jgi:hypothetical protein
LGGTGKFQLDRAILRGLSNRRSTMTNLSATLALVDFEQPRISPLLTVPRQTHGRMQGPVFGPRHDAAFRHLDEWVALVTAETTTLLPVAPPADQVEPLASGGELSSAGVGNRPALYQESQFTEEPEAPAVADETTAKSRLRYGAQLERWRPRDPFDPEIFHRKFAPRPDASADPAASQHALKAEP